jgi:hypothetical protein
MPKPPPQYPAQSRPIAPPSGCLAILILAQKVKRSVPLKSQAFDNESYFESVLFQGSSVTLRHRGNRDQIRLFALSPKVAINR